MIPRPWWWDQVAAHNTESDCWVILSVGGTLETLSPKP